MTLDFDAVLLAGGRASRLGGDDKSAFLSDGATLLERAVEAAAGARAVVVVGAREGTRLPADAIATREDPPWAGPVAALAAGLAAVAVRADPAPLTLVLACDLPRAPEAVRALRDGAPADETLTARDGLLAVDDDGRRQPLLALYRTASLRARLAELEAEGPLTGLSLRKLLAPFDLVEVPVASGLCADVDTDEDVARLSVERPTGPTTG